MHTVSPTANNGTTPVLTRTAQPAGTEGLLLVPKLSANYGFSFPTVEECRSGAESIGSWEWNGREGAVPQIEVAPGLIRLTAPDLNKRERRLNRDADRPVEVSLDAVGVKVPCLDLLWVLRVLRLSVEVEHLVWVHDDVERLAGVREELRELGVSGSEDGRMITSWSRKSRARMVATMAELDLAPLLLAGDKPAMITLTYPGDWEVVAPNGEVAKGHLLAFFKRYERAWGESLVDVWKMEFQRRGAPHFHLLMSPPQGVAGAGRRAEYELKVAEWELKLEQHKQLMSTWKEGEDKPRKPRKPYWRDYAGDGSEFREWLSIVWADIVNHPDKDDSCIELERKAFEAHDRDFVFCEHEGCKHRRAGTAVDYSEGERARDPKRAAVYFGKHGSFAAKDYQHDVPELWKESGKSVGRFWGYRGLEKIKGAATLDADTMLFLGRVLRGYGTRTRVWNPNTRSHEVRPVLVTKNRPRRTILADGTIKQARDKETGELLFDDEGNPVDHVRIRKTTSRGKRMTGNMATGFLLVNDGPNMAKVLARAIESCRGDNGGVLPVGMRGSVRGRNY